MAVYFIQAGRNGPIKIGHSVDPAGRLESLQTSHYERLVLLGTVAGDVDYEQHLHRQLGRDCVMGEWFSPTERVVRAVVLHLLASEGRDVSRLDHFGCLRGQKIESAVPTLKERRRRARELIAKRHGRWVRQFAP